MTTFREGGIGLFTALKLKAAPLLPTRPSAVIQSGAIPDVEHFLSLLRSLAQGIDLQALQTSHVVRFTLVCSFPGKGEMIQESRS